LNQKRLTIGLIVLLIGTSVIPITAQDIKKPSLPTSRADWLYVGGSGPGNYTSIQDALNHASPGFTIFVYDDSSPYHETITIQTSVSLIGENKETTILNGGDNLQVITVHASTVNISHFTFENSDIGILGSINDSVIFDNIFLNNQGGVALFASSANTISENTIGPGYYYNEVGIVFTYNCHDNIISHNYVQKCLVGIGLQGKCNHNTITDNTLCNNYYGVDLYYVFFNVIEKNNFMDNNKSAYFVISFLNRWTKNYWDDWSGKGPKLISGLCTYPWDPWNDTKGIPYINFDWHPAQEPYDI
jgi:parallel beta-helix repeat protein